MCSQLNIIMRAYELLEAELTPEEILQTENAGAAVNLCKARGRRWPAAEEFIARDVYWSKWYALDVIQGRWPECEPALLKQVRSTGTITNDVARYQRVAGLETWPELEQALTQSTPVAKLGWNQVNAINLYQHESQWKNRIWPVGDAHVLNKAKPEALARWAVRRGGGKPPRWPEAEPKILRNGIGAAMYAKYVIKGRWPEAEPIILKNARGAYDYALGVIGGRWPEAEPTIARDDISWSMYARDVFGVDNMRPGGRQERARMRAQAEAGETVTPPDPATKTQWGPKQ
jgi:hypothetical protein